MIRPAQRKLLDRARQAKASDATDFAEVLRRCGGVDSVEALTARSFDRLMDHFTVQGFRCRERPILSPETQKLIGEAARLLDLSDHTYNADLRGHAGASDLRDMTGYGLIDLLTRWEHRGLKVATFTAKRRSITTAQLKLIQVARKQNAMEDRRYYGMLQGLGGVVTATDLDGRGFDLCMAFLNAEGFEREMPASAAPGFGIRAGFASPEQVELIRSLWREWFRPTSEAEAVVEAALNDWLEKYHRASSLRFLTTASAGKVITALRAMKSRATSVGAR